MGSADIIYWSCRHYPPKEIARGWPMSWRGTVPASGSSRRNTAKRLLDLLGLGFWPGKAEQGVIGVTPVTQPPVTRGRVRPRSGRCAGVCSASASERGCPPCGHALSTPGSSTDAATEPAEVAPAADRGRFWPLAKIAVFDIAGPLVAYFPAAIGRPHHGERPGPQRHLPGRRARPRNGP